jgi:hypothetical protein
MSRSNSMLEKANAFDKNGSIKREVEIEFGRLKELRQKYPFTENLRTIEWLDPDKLFKVNPDEVGDFFRLIETTLKPFGNPTLSSSNIYRNARLQIQDFKNLLRIVVDNRRSLAQKVDAPWEKIGGLGQDKQLAKKIIYCFNYENKAVLPIFNNQYMRHFTNRISDTFVAQTKYLSLGQEYEHYTADLLKTKNSFPLTQGWDTLYFTRFLYGTYPPPDTEHATEDKKAAVITDEQLDLQSFVKLLGELQSKGKITGQQFREYRELWMHQQPNDRDILVWRLKELLKTEPKPPPPKNQDEMQKRPTRQRL